MALERSIFLIGYRGTGKTTVAQRLAKLFECEWSDSDVLIEQQSGQTVTEIFSTDGEAVFRDREEQAIAELVGGARQVVSLGGGAVLREANRRAIEGHHVVWLQAPPTVIAQRLSTDVHSATQRPSLTGAGLLTEIEQVLAERTPIYQQCATIEVDTENRSPEVIADQIYRELSSQ